MVKIMANNKNFERELPKGYKEVFRIDAKKKNTAIILSLAALGIFAVVFVLLLIPFFRSGIDLSDISAGSFFLFYGVIFVTMLVYIVAHELTHGLVYKVMTGEKLTFGLTLSVAFCGVPGIYTYRKCALYAVLAPMVVFTAVLLPTVIFLSFVNPLYYIGFSFIFAAHLSGCAGDGYLGYLLLTKFRGEDVLMKDTGPTQLIYEKKK